MVSASTAQPYHDRVKVLQAKPSLREGDPGLPGCCSAHSGAALGPRPCLLDLRGDADLRAAVDRWFEAQPRRPDDVLESDWLRFEQDKHERLLAAAAALT